MKRFAILALPIFFILLIIASVAAAAYVVGSKHDLSMPPGVDGGTGPGPIQSTDAGTTEICVFCHTPHNARAGAPLWNRSIRQASYTVYTSDVMADLGMTAEDPTDTGAAGYAVHTKTRICLSCHDGTIALGNLANWRGSPSNVPMLNTDGGYMPNTSAGYIGIDLSDDHPVAVIHNAGSGANQDPELKNPVTGNVRLYDGNYMECTSCHNVHDNVNGNFLVDDNVGSKICTSCHEKKTGTGALPDGLAHTNAGDLYNPGNDGKIGTTVGNVACMACHYPHRSGATGAAYPFSKFTNVQGGQYLLTFQEEITCFNNPNRWNFAPNQNVCHGQSSSTKDIETLVGKNYAHNSSDNPGKHRALEQGKSGNAKYGTLVGDWHVQCNDCHNSHTAGRTTHTSPMLGLIAIPDTSPLYGAGGVKIPAASNPPIQSNFTAFESLGVTNTSGMHLDYYEYQICYKCHSSFAWGTNPAPNSPSLGAAMTDQAAEFRLGIGRSFHPIQGVTGRTAGNLRTAPPPPFLNWQANIGNQTMYCSDCHAQEGYASLGPHGSNYPFILGNTFQDQYGTRGMGDLEKQPGDLCFDCHDSTEYLPTANGQIAAGTGFYMVQGVNNINLHTQHAFRAVTPMNPLNPVNPYPYRCVNCHARIPHGMDRKALIVLTTDAAQYRPGAGMISFFNAQAGGYVMGNCTTVSGCHIP
jgi:predicted CXXCH cytochrome family protein